MRRTRPRCHFRIVSGLKRSRYWSSRRRGPAVSRASAAARTAKVSFSLRVSRGWLALQQAHLLAQHEDLEVVGAVALPPAEDRVDEERDQMREHEPEHPALILLGKSARGDSQHVAERGEPVRAPPLSTDLFP
jgi:hypothetical protein